LVGCFPGFYSVSEAQIERVGKLVPSQGLRLGRRARRVAEGEKAREPPALGFVRIHGEMLEVAAARVCYVVRTARDRASRPAVIEVERQRRVDRNRRV